MVKILMLECDGCHKKVFTVEGRNPDRKLECDCCPEDHDHGKSANETGIACRPMTIFVLPGSAQLKVME